MFVAMLLVLAAGDAEPAEKVKAIATADWKALDANARLAAKPLVLRSVKDLVAAMPTQAGRNAAREVVEKQVGARAAKALGQKEIDWDKQMLVVVAAGKQPTTGWKIEVVSLKVKGGTLTVAWKLDGSEAKDDAISYPALAALVPAHKGKVVFEQVK